MNQNQAGEGVQIGAEARRRIGVRRQFCALQEGAAAPKWNWTVGRLEVPTVAPARAGATD